jgi:hypothetical protein
MSERREAGTPLILVGPSVYAWRYPTEEVIAIDDNLQVLKARTQDSICQDTTPRLHYTMSTRLRRTHFAYCGILAELK